MIDDREIPDDDAEGDDDLWVRAVVLARAGRFERIEELLRAAIQVGDCSQAQALDLRARICVQNGLLFEAEGLWREALRSEPGNVAILAALERLHAKRGGGWGRIVLVAIVLIGVGVVAWDAQARVHSRDAFERSERAVDRLGVLLRDSSERSEIRGLLNRKLDSLQIRLEHRMDSVSAKENATIREMKRLRAELSKMRDPSKNQSQPNH
jgi:tetratricopeptide (TPR) repeat protein